MDLEEFIETEFEKIAPDSKGYDSVIDSFTSLSFAKRMAQKVFEATKQACANNATTVSDGFCTYIDTDSIFNIKIEDLEL